MFKTIIFILVLVFSIDCKYDEYYDDFDYEYDYNRGHKERNEDKEATTTTAAPPKSNNCVQATPKVLCPRDAPGDVTGFDKLGVFTGNKSDGTPFRRQYYFNTAYRKSDWAVARTICYTNNLDMVWFDSKAEYDVFVSLLNNYAPLSQQALYWLILDGINEGVPRTTEWYSSFNGKKKLSWNLPWRAGEPNDPYEKCLWLMKDNGYYSFIDIDCSMGALGAYFVCQKDDPCYP